MTESAPIPAFLASQFYMWLWWASEKQGGNFFLKSLEENITLHVDEKLAFKEANDKKISVTLAGDSPSTTIESRATLVGGKIIEEIRLQIERDYRAFFVTLSGSEMKFKNIKLPILLSGCDEEAIYDRLFLYDELTMIITDLLNQFCEIRLSPEWVNTIENEIQTWAIGGNND